MRMNFLPKNEGVQEQKTSEMIDKPNSNGL
jgi:hypothetical protein